MPGIWLIGKALAFLEVGRFVGMQLPCHSVPSAVSQGEGTGLGFN